MSYLLEKLFGCWHETTSFPIKTKDRNKPYVVCLTCGKEWEYNWRAMKQGPEITLEQKEENLNLSDATVRAS